jgi:hypothetical protein
VRAVSVISAHALLATSAINATAAIRPKNTYEGAPNPEARVSDGNPAGGGVEGADGAGGAGGIGSAAESG